MTSRADIPPDTFAPRSRLARNVAWSYVNWISSFAAPLILIPLYVRMLGHQLYGEWLVIMSVASYLGLASLGSWQAVANRITEALANDRRADAARLISTAFFAYSAIIAIVTAAIFVATPAVWHRLMPSSAGSAPAAFYIFIALSALAFPTRAYAVMLRAYERVDLDQLIGVCSNVGRIAAMAAALLAGLKLAAVAIIQGGAMVATGVASYAAAIWLDPDARPRIARFSGPMLSSLIKPSAGFFGLTVASTLAFGIDNLVIGYAIGARAVTQYAVAFRLVTMVSGAFAVGIASLWPTMTKYHARDRRDVLRAGFIVMMRIALLFGAAAALALWLWGPAFIRIWAGPGVFPGRATFGLQLLLMFIQMLVTPADAILMATTRHYAYALMAVGEGVLNLALSLWWVRYFGMAGVIGGTIAARLLTNGWYMPFAALETIGMNPAELIREIPRLGDWRIAREPA